MFLCRFNVWCGSETLFDSFTLSDKGNVEIPGILVRADHSSNSKRDAVCFYYCSTLPLKVLGIYYL